jgi:tetratricopeptide (TPR) repeat protein
VQACAVQGLEGGILAISKRKSLENAQKYVQKGAFDKALKEYLKHLKSEPDDTNARLKLGDLHLKRGDPDAAIEAYGQVASQFSKGGFDAKAVAIFKQILCIDAQNLDTHMKLGDHYQRMGLNKDALREFQEGVKICQERELKTQAFDLLKRVSALDPGNVPNRLSLADLFLREGMKDEAKAEFKSLLGEVEREAEGENLERVSHEMLEAFPDEERAHRAFAAAKIKLGQPEQAVEALAGVTGSFVESVEIREALVEALEAAGDPERAKSTYREIAELYKRRGDADKARDILQRHVPVEAFGRDAPETSPSLLLNEVHDATPQPDGLDDSADTLGDSLELDDEALESEPTSLAAEPEPEAAAPEQSPEDLLAEARVALEFGDPDAARPSLEKLLELDPASVEGRKLLATIERGGDDDDAMDDPSFDSLPDIELVLEDEDTELGDEYASVKAPPELELTETVDGDATAGSAQVGLVASKLEEADRLFEVGESEQAEEAYRVVLEIAPNHPQAMVRLGELEAQKGVEPAGGPEPAAAPQDEVSIDDGFEFEFEEEEALLEQPEQAEAIEVEIEPVVEVKPKPKAKPKPEPEPAEPEQLIDAESFADVFADDDEDEEDASAQDDFDLAAELDDEDGASEEDFQQVLDAFKKGVQEQIGEDESAAHYDLAIAYKEMGLLDDAIEQLDLVRRSGELQIEALSTMASCKLELGRPQEAAGHLSEALVCTSDGDVAQVALRYDLGEALAAAGKHGEALEAFQKVEAADADFRDVQAKISELGG